ncbi:NADH dehydrogenase 1 alpha subcomplex assembly factor 3 [Schizothecium vesticola]|uniref:NADH dehydrogenase 1 alpha subcomplex assembly factor 3 n=1 Tax=Schizothecium vesticola TaxID=314040 RepID=A0AA40F9B5_9PEZI|nr:NADH dehydrogenase 1 alpha subcomplex assembly factor 3 [Schizothecium vesticola]
MDVLGNTPVPASSIVACLDDGFTFQNGLRVDGGDGVLIVGGEVVRWRPWLAMGGKGGGNRFVNAKGQWEVPGGVLGVLGAVWPRADLLILALGPEMRPLSPETRRMVSEMGVKVEVLDTRNAAAQYNMLATERGVGEVAAAMVPVGWVEGVGVRRS